MFGVSLAHSLSLSQTIKATSALGDPRVTYTLEEGQVAETNMPVRFYLKPNRAEGSASLLVAENLDYEATPIFTLRVRVQNVAAVPLASFTTVHVNVTGEGEVGFDGALGRSKVKPWTLPCFSLSSELFFD